MNVELTVQFEEPTEETLVELRTVVQSLSDDPERIRVYADQEQKGDGLEDAGWLIAEFSMATLPEEEAVDRIAKALDSSLADRLDSTISFPKER